MPLSLTCTLHIQCSLYFKTTHGTKKKWSYIAGGPKIKTTHGTKKKWSYIAGGLKIKVMNTENALWDQIKRLLYWAGSQYTCIEPGVSV